MEHQCQTTHATQLAIANTNGFVMVGLGVLLPLLLIFLFGFISLALVLRNYTIATASCRQEAWETQRALGRNLESLQRLNPRATQLRMERRLAEMNAKTASVSLIPPAIAAAQARLALVIAQQMVHRALQQKILLEAIVTRAKGHSALPWRARRVHSQMRPSVDQVAGLAVRADPEGDLTPDYVTRNNFKRAQTIQLKWSANLLAQFPDWLLKNQFFSTQRFAGECAATLKQEGLQWLPTLTAVRF
jgi:hypothetical protein